MVKTSLNKKTSILAKNITAGYGDDPAIRNINLEIPKGKIFGLIGLNGAGKTTFIKTVLDLLKADKGSILTDGEVVYLPEKFEPPAFLSGYEFLRFALSFYNKSASDDDIKDNAGQLALQLEALSRRCNTYSKGMKQKIGLMSAFMSPAPVIILDEPMSGLDPLARACVKDKILECRKAGRTVFLSSHILADMDEICDTIAVIDQGVVKFTGTPKALKKQGKEDYLERAFLSIIK
mgnify:CR=1 FL=1